MTMMNISLPDALQTFVDEHVRERGYSEVDASAEAAQGLMDDLERSLFHISRNPVTGSNRYAHELNLPGLKSWTLSRYPYLVFYVERPDHIDVWRVLNDQRDIPAWMREAAGA